MTETAIPQPRIFISYSWTSQAYQAWIVQLCERLVSDGVDVVLDVWALREGQDKYEFMERMVNDPAISKVLVISDRKYAEKANQRSGGVGTESLIISNEVYQRADQTKFVAIAREKDESGKPSLPIFLGGNRIYVDMSSPELEAENYPQLLRVIYNRPTYVRPPLGNPPAYLFEERESTTRTIGRFQAIRGHINAGRSLPLGLLADYVDEFILGLEGTRIPNPEDQSEPIDEQVLRSIQDALPYRDEFIELTLLLGRQNSDAAVFDAVVPLFERAARLVEPPENVASYRDSWYENFTFMRWELFLYWIAGLIETKRVDVATSFLERRYYVTSRFHSGTLKTFGSFDGYLSTFDEYRKRRMNLNRLSVTADIAKQRAYHRTLTFEKLMQTDLVLFARSLVDQADRGGTAVWYPKTLVYAGYGKKFELFERATSRSQAYPVIKLLGFDSIDALKRRLTELLQNGRRRLEHIEFHWDVSIPNLLNLERIGSIS